MVDFELIGGDDGFADNTYEIVVSLQFLDNRLSVFKSSGIGKNTAFDMAFQNRNGDAICSLANFAGAIPHTENLDENFDCTKVNA